MKQVKRIFENAGGYFEVEDVTQDEWTFTDTLDVDKFADGIARQCIFELVHDAQRSSFAGIPG